NNKLKEKYNYNFGELNNTPIYTRENSTKSECGEITRELAEFAEEHTPEKTIPKK
ncbi:MAG: hypothetical protein H0Z40_07860, partial [Desulfotomaculum sp.]|nr:hypothetical protein [Desulfotomaculum sp.]